MTAEEEKAKPTLRDLRCQAADCGCPGWKRNKAKVTRCKNWNRRGDRCDHSVELHNFPAYLVIA
jgi:hypothetical protein